ncbi:hypothetical protein TNIN_5791, partial [Trichonephila inaurata madagascariensis]
VDGPLLTHPCSKRLRPPHGRNPIPPYLRSSRKVKAEIEAGPSLTVPAGPEGGGEILFHTNSHSSITYWSTWFLDGVRTRICHGLENRCHHLLFLSAWTMSKLEKSLESIPSPQT